MREMKDSGIEWIGKIPEDWLCIKAKNIIKSNDGGVWGNEPTSTENDKVVLRSTEQTIDGKWMIEDPAKRDLSEISYKNCLIQPNDLLITKSSGSSLHIGKTTLADDYFTTNECYYSNFLQRIRLKKSYYPLYAWFIFNAVFVREQFAYMQNSTSGLGNINSTDIGNIIVPIPPLTVQQRIAEFLDRECEKIDGLKADIQTQIDTLEQYKRSVITEAVTHGLNPSAPMKDSGIPWVGEIPSHWIVIPLKYITIGNKESLTESTPSDYEFDYIDIGSVTYGKGIEQYQHYRFKDAPSRARRVVKKDDVIISTVRTYLKATAQIPEHDEQIIVSTGFLTLTPKIDKIIPCFLGFAVQLHSFVCTVEADSCGVSYPAINATDLLRKKIILPPISEQQAIADYLDNKCAEIDKTIADKKAQIETLDGYKKSLIYEYVTGKKEVV